jgi:hypothetical protein
MSPALFLALLLGLTALAWLQQTLFDAVVARRLSRIGHAHGMLHARADRFDLARRISERLPVPGAADVRVSDVLYCSRDNCYRYVFTVDYTIGLIHGHRRVRRVGSLLLPRSEAAAGPELILSEGRTPRMSAYQLFLSDEPQAQE